MEEKLQFTPFSSALGHGFWYNFNRMKLDVYKLDTNAIDIFGYYKNDTPADLPPCLNVDYTAFEKDMKIPPNSFLMRGKLVNFNTSDALKNSDKKMLIDRIGKEIWDDIKGGLTLKDPTLLNKFLIVSYADLKKFQYCYWFAFPAICIPDLIYTQKNLKKLQDAFLSTQISQLQKQYDEHSQKSHFVIEIADDDLTLHSFDYLKNVDVGEKRIIIGFSDPSGLPCNPSWVLRNLLIQLCHLSIFDGKDIEILCFRDVYKDGVRNSSNSIVITITIPNISPETEFLNFLGWEKNERQKYGPRLVNLSRTMDPVNIAESAVDLNLKLIRWRILPDLDLDLLKETKCLLLGSGTLGCNIARCLLGWGIRNITLVDNANVSYSNPVRQSLFVFEDSVNGGKSKAEAAAKSLKLIFPGVNAVGIDLSIPMPGHAVSPSVLPQVKEDIKKLENLIETYDVVFLLMDTRESRWLPTLISSCKQKIVINAALGFDSYLVMRHGVKSTDEPSESSIDIRIIPGSNLGCYFCNDVVAPADSTRDRTLDQACTVSRPGVSMIAAALAAELLVSLLQHPERGNAPANSSRDYIDEDKLSSILGIIPHQIRGFMSQFSQVIPATASFNKCTACSSVVKDQYEKDGFEFLLNAFNDPEFLEDVSGLTALKQDTLSAEIWELDD